MNLRELYNRLKALFPLGDLTEAQVRALIEEAVEGFRESMSDIARAQTPEVPF